MAILKGCEIYFLKAVKPSAKYNKANPTWEVQIRTEDKVKKKEWEEMGLRVKAVVPDEGNPYFRVNIKKKSLKKDGSASNPPDVIDRWLQPMNPKIIGNGSIGNVKIFIYDYEMDGEKLKGATLMGVQITKLVKYTPKASDDDFDEVEDSEDEDIGDFSDMEDDASDVLPD